MIERIESTLSLSAGRLTSTAARPSLPQGADRARRALNQHPSVKGDKMMLRRMSASLSLILVAALAAVPATMAQDKVRGEFDLAWNGCFTAPGDEVPDWVGTIDLEGDVHDMVFFNLGDGRPPGQDLPEGSGAFIEIWAVYDGLELAYDADCVPETYAGELVMWGHDAGVSDYEAQEYAMTGTIVEAFGDHADLAGQPVAMSGTFTMTGEGGPATAPGVMEIG